jgi:hypothetical protein
MSLSITLNSFFIPFSRIVCIIVMFSVHFFHFHSRLLSKPLIPFPSSSFLLSTCCARMCFKNLFQFNKQAALKSIG